MDNTLTKKCSISLTCKLKPQCDISIYLSKWLCFLIWVMLIQIGLFVKISQSVPLQFVYFMYIN